jgi:hypothetical protein
VSKGLTRPQKNLLDYLKRWPGDTSLNVATIGQLVFILIGLYLQNRRIKRFTGENKWGKKDKKDEKAEGTSETDA